MQAWSEFLQSIGGAENLNYGWTRQSGKKWSISLSSETRQRNHLRLLVHEGVPNAYRSDVWFHLSGGKELQDRSPNTFSQLYQSQLDERVKELIETVDLATLYYLGYQQDISYTSTVRKGKVCNCKRVIFIC